MKQNIPFVLTSLMLLLTSFKSLIFAQCACIPLKDDFGSTANCAGFNQSTTNAAIVNHTIHAYTPGGMPDCPSDGEYSIRCDGAELNAGFHGGNGSFIEDNTFDAAGQYGNYVIINSGAGPREFYHKTLTNLCPNTTYNLTYYAGNIVKADTSGICYYSLHPSLQAYIFPGGTAVQVETSLSSAGFSSIGGTLLGSTGNMICTVSTDWGGPGMVWNQYSYNFTTGASQTSIHIVLVSLNGNGAGGDFAFDDVTVTMTGCTSSVSYNTIKGNIYNDSNQDCNFQTAESSLSSVIVKALPGPYYGISDAYGKYQVRVDSGTVNYFLTHEYNPLNSQFLVNQCTTSYNILLNGAGKDTASFDFADSVKQCSMLNISIQKARARRCFRNSTFIKYYNHGNFPAAGTQIKIEYPSDIIPLSSIPMWSSQQGSFLTYNIGTVQPGAGGQIIITDSVSCIAGITGLTECIKASISPASNCIPIDPAWDRSSMKVTGTCQNGNAHFVITNDGTGDMGSSLKYRVYENDTLIYTGTYQLKSGENFTVDYPAQGQTIRLEADQHPLHPGKSHPRATIENCGVASPEVRNLVTTAPQDDLDEETATTCAVIRDSYDPNLKQALPSGIGVAHNVIPGQELEYVIHFQNTGTDTAYTVIVVDTLDAGLDVASFTQGTSSHPYTLGITGKGQAVLTFRFDQINLPDSTTNNLASSGLVSFRMTVPSNASTGTVIKNKAYIYFDYNAPIVTNETMHTVDNTVPTDMSKGSLVAIGAITTSLTNKRNNLAVKIYPNPTNGLVTVEMPESAYSSEMRVYSVVGVLQKSVMLDKSVTQQVNLESIPEGLYLYEILQNGERKAGGMLKIK